MKMPNEVFDFDVFPKVFICGEEQCITIVSQGKHFVFCADKKYHIEVWPVENGDRRIYKNNANDDTIDAEFVNASTIKFRYTFPDEQQYCCRIYEEDRWMSHCSVYALNEDMRGRYPYRGDLHIHTDRSDGREGAACVCGEYRRNGYDFMVISDHQRYYPSLEAIEDYKDVPIDLCIVPGEEVHLPGNDVHIVNFGGEYSVNGLLSSREQSKESDKRAIIPNPPPVIDDEEFKAQVEALIPELNIPDGIDKFTYAACIWIYRHIQKGNGLAIFAHPLWLSSSAFQVPMKLYDYMTEKHEFDAFEVLGGENYFEQNGFQTIHYYEDMAKGIKYPVVGSTDSHSCINNRNGYICSTIVFAKANERKAIIDSIKSFYSVAVDTISEEARMIGELRLVKYAWFLWKNYFPIHDQICAEEGRMMKTWAASHDEEAKKFLEFAHGRTERAIKKYFNL